MQTAQGEGRDCGKWRQFPWRVLSALSTRLPAPWPLLSSTLPARGALWGAGVGMPCMSWAQVAVLFPFS